MPEQRAAVDEMFSLAYEELRRLAVKVRGDNVNVTLNPTALVHEVWLKLAASESLDPTSQLHFRRVAARAMRQVLVDAARRRNTTKRGSGTVWVTFDDEREQTVDAAEDVLQLDAALEELAQLSPRQAAMVENRFFGGFDVAQTAELLGISQATVMRDWRAARAWLALRLRQGERAAVSEEKT